MCRTADWIILNLLLYLNLQTVDVTGVLTRGLSAPRFISSWTQMDTADNTTTEIIYEHGFNENPVKAEVQVREVGKEMIFPGIKSANVVRPRKMPNEARVGVLCLYNATHVRIMAPPKTGTMTNYLIYTGNLDWAGTRRKMSTKGEVRVRVWHKDDLPAGDFFMSNRIMSSTHNHSTIKHNVTSHRFHANVQLMFEDGWIAEAQGSESHYQIDESQGWNGIVYATSKEDIQLWAPTANANGLVFTYFGWGTCTNISDCMYTKVNASISLWDTTRFGSSYKCDSNAFGNHNTGKRFAHNAPEKFNIDNDILDITATVQIPRIAGGRDYIFPGTGTAMMDETNNPVGLVYGFNTMTNEMQIWHPMCSSNKCFFVKIGNHSDRSALVNYCVWRGFKRMHTSGTTESTSSSITTPSTKNDLTSHTNLGQTLVTLTTKELLSTTLRPMHQPSKTGFTTDVHHSMAKMSESISGVKLSGDTASTPAVIWKGPVLCLGHYPDSCIDFADMGQNVFIDFSRIRDDTVGYGYVMFMCKTGYVAQSGDANRTINLRTGTISLSGDPLICKERNQVHGKAETEARLKELVKNLTLPSNSTSKHRRSLESARDVRIASRAIGVVSGVVIGGLIALVVINDLTRFVRYMCSL